jgi:hypothetical protein
MEPCLQEPLMIPAMSQINPVHTFISYILKVQFNIILQPTLKSPGLPLLFKLLDSYFIMHCSSLPRVLHARTSRNLLLLILCKSKTSEK